MWHWIVSIDCFEQHYTLSQAKSPLLCVSQVQTCIWHSCGSS